MNNNSRGFLVTLSKLTAILVTFITIVILASCYGGGSSQKGWSGGTLAGDTLYIGSRDGKMIAVNVADNSRAWAVPLETGTRSSGLGCGSTAIIAYIYGSPATSDNMVYIGADNGKVYSLIPGDDQPDRTLDKVRVGDKDIEIGQIVGSIVIADSILYFGDAEGRVYAVNDRLQPVWEQPFKTGDKIWSTPAVSDSTVYIGSYDHKLYALEAATGEKKWEFESDGAFVSTPVVDGNTVYAGSFDKHFYAINANDGSLRWSFEGKNAFFAKPVVHNGLIYAACNDVKGTVYVLRASDGNKVAEIITNGQIYADPVLVGEKLIVATIESKGSGNIKRGAAIWAIDITNNQGSEISRMAGEKVYAPLTADKTSVYVHTNKDGLYGIGVDSGAVRQFTIK
jgi:eukaryotic-like serine/threonine-protein kinase